MRLVGGTQKKVEGGEDFFEKAGKSLRGHGIQIGILKISDFNTTGMVYEEDNRGCDYHSFMKAVGSSFKQGSAGGSWGLGKGSYFVASSYRTIFVSSVYRNDKHLFQGKLRLSSHEIDGEIRQGNGSFGLPNQKPVTDPELIPKLFKREEQGTSIYIVGFREQRTWKEEIKKSVLDNFWPAIYKGMLEVEIAGEEINKENLEQMLTDTYSLDDADTDDDPNPLPYYYAYTSTENRKMYEGTFPILNKIQLYVLEDEKFKNRVACMRSTGMIIQKAGFRSTKRYAAVFECDNEKGNEILQRMENPTHDSWRVHNAVEPSDELVGADNEFRSFIRGSLSNLSKLEEKTALMIKGLEKYLGLPADESYVTGSPFDTGGLGEPKESDEERGAEAGKFGFGDPTQQPKIKTVIQIIENEGAGGEGEEVFRAGKGSGGKGDRETGRKSGKGGPERMVVPITYRTFAVENADNKIEHLLIVRSLYQKNVDIEFSAGTDSELIPINVEYAKGVDGVKLQVKNCWIKGINLEPNNVLKVRVKFATEERFSLHLKAYENK